MTLKQMDEFTQIVNQVLPAFAIEKNTNSSVYVYPEKPTSMGGTALKVLINAISLFGFSFFITAEIGRGIKVEVF